MAVVDDIRSKVADYLQGDYEVTDAKAIPSAEDILFGKLAKKMNLTVFCIDLRQSTDLLFLHNKQTAGKIHKSFLHVVSATVRHFEGYIRSFNGDSLLAFWPAFYKGQITSCVRAAMTVKWLLDVELSPMFEEYKKLDFGIGVDWGEVFIARAGLPRDPNSNDLIFMGRCVNYAVAVAQQARGPNHVEISTGTYANLEDEAIYGLKDGAKVDMWRDAVVKWHDQDYKSKLTTWYWRL